MAVYLIGKLCSAEARIRLIQEKKLPPPSVNFSFGGSTGLINNSTNNMAIDNFERQFLRVLNKVYQTIERNDARLAEQDRRDAIKLEWQQVALVIDR